MVVSAKRKWIKRVFGGTLSVFVNVPSFSTKEAVGKTTLANLTVSILH